MYSTTSRRHGALKPEPHVRIGERDQQHREDQHEDLGPAASTWHRHLRFRNAAERRIIRRRDAAHDVLLAVGLGDTGCVADGDTDGAATTDTPSAPAPGQSVGTVGSGDADGLGFLLALAAAAARPAGSAVRYGCRGGLALVGLGLQLADDAVGVAQVRGRDRAPDHLQFLRRDLRSVRELREYTLDRLTPATRWLTPRKIVTCPWLVPRSTGAGCIPGPVAAADHHRGQHDQRHRHDRPAPRCAGGRGARCGTRWRPSRPGRRSPARHRASRPARSAARPA